MLKFCGPWIRFNSYAVGQRAKCQMSKYDKRVKSVNGRGSPCRYANSSVWHSYQKPGDGAQKFYFIVFTYVVVMPSPL